MGERRRLVAAHVLLPVPRCPRLGPPVVRVHHPRPSPKQLLLPPSIAIALRPDKEHRWCRRQEQQHQGTEGQRQEPKPSTKAEAAPASFSSSFSSSAPSSRPSPVHLLRGGNCIWRTGPRPPSRPWCAGAWWSLGGRSGCGVYHRHGAVGVSSAARPIGGRTSNGPPVYPGEAEAFGVHRLAPAASVCELGLGSGQDHNVVVARVRVFCQIHNHSPSPPPSSCIVRRTETRRFGSTPSTRGIAFECLKIRCVRHLPRVSERAAEGAQRGGWERQRHKTKGRGRCCVGFASSWFCSMFFVWGDYHQSSRNALLVIHLSTEFGHPAFSSLSHALLHTKYEYALLPRVNQIMQVLL